MAEPILKKPLIGVTAAYPACLPLPISFPPHLGHWMSVFTWDLPFFEIMSHLFTLVRIVAEHNNFNAAFVCNGEFHCYPACFTAKFRGF